MGTTRILALTSGRADYSIIYPILTALDLDPSFELKVVALGTHVSRHFGHGVDQVLADGFEVLALPSIILGEGAEATAAGIGTTALKFSSLWALERPDAILCVGDRYEIFAAVISSIPFRIPVIHYHGGEITLGSVDEIYRTAITAASVLHFTSCEEYARRVRDILGAAEGRHVEAVGALAIDTIKNTPLLSAAEFDAKFGTMVAEPTALFTFHPVTQYPDESVLPCLDSLAQLSVRKLITMPNVDHGAGEIRAQILERFGDDPSARIVEALGRDGFYSALNLCQFVLGNSSAGIVEAGYFGIPVVNVGRRQKGRIRPKNVIDCDNDFASIQYAIRDAQAAPRTVDTSVYGDGTAVEKSLNTIRAYFNEQ